MSDCHCDECHCGKQDAPAYEDLQKRVDELEAIAYMHPDTSTYRGGRTWRQQADFLKTTLLSMQKENAQLTKKLGWYEAPHDEAAFNVIREQASHRDSLAACTIYIAHLERRIKELTTILSAEYQRGIEEGKKMEREWCISICENTYDEYNIDGTPRKMQYVCADAIRSSIKT